MTQNWKSIKVREETYNEIEKTLKTKMAKEMGLTNLTQFANYSITQQIEKLKPKRLEHVNMYEDHVKIMDNKLGKVGRIISVYFKKRQNSWCDYCEENNCIHVQFAWEIPDVRSILLNNDLKPPPSRIK